MFFSSSEIDCFFGNRQLSNACASRGLAKKHVFFVMRGLPANTRRCPDVGPMLGQRRRRWPSVGPTSGQRLVFAGLNLTRALI